MKQVRCGYEGCSDRRIHWEEPDVMRPHQMVEVHDDFDENVEKSFCSFECACYAGYMTLNDGRGRKYVDYGGCRWLKDPSGGKNLAFAKLNIKEKS